MDVEELEPRRKPAQPKDLTLLGIEELEAYIAELEEAVNRTRARRPAEDAGLGNQESQPLET